MLFVLFNKKLTTSGSGSVLLEETKTIRCVRLFVCVYMCVCVYVCARVWLWLVGSREHR